MHYAGKKGFIPVSPKKDDGRTLNLWQLSGIVDKLVAEKNEQPAGDKVFVDLKQLGFRKLLGAGSISRAVQVKVDECSEGAAKKLKDAGGEHINTTAAK